MKLPVYMYGHPVLREVAEDVPEDFEGLQKLVDDGVVKQEAARELLDKQAIYAEYCAAAKLPEGRIAMAMRSTVKMAARIPALGMTTESTADADMAVILDENGMQMSAVVKSTTGEQTATVKEWLKDIDFQL